MPSSDLLISQLRDITCLSSPLPTTCVHPQPYLKQIKQEFNERDEPTLLMRKSVVVQSPMNQGPEFHTGISNPTSSSPSAITSTYPISGANTLISHIAGIVLLPSIPPPYPLSLCCLSCLGACCAVTQYKNASRNWRRNSSASTTYALPCVMTPKPGFRDHFSCLPYLAVLLKPEAASLRLPINHHPNICW